MYDNEPKKLERNNQRDILEYQIIFLFTSMVLMMVNKIIDFMSAAGVQMDCIATEDGEDSWDAIWDSEVSITDFGCRDENSLRRFMILNQKVKHGD
jgi:hypothetical protein